MIGKQLVDRIIRDPKNVNKTVYIRYGSSDLLKIGKVVVLSDHMILVAEDRQEGER